MECPGCGGPVVQLLRATMSAPAEYGCLRCDLGIPRDQWNAALERERARTDPRLREELRLEARGVDF